MAAHDDYDNDILKQLTRIANSLERIEKDLTRKQMIKFDESSYNQVNQEIHNWPDWKKEAYNEDFQSTHSERLEIGKEIEANV